MSPLLSPRESEFVATVAQCGGYFIRRQFSAGRGIDTQVLCEKLAALGIGRKAAVCGQTQVFQLFGARRRQTRHILECLMRLDYALDFPGVQPGAAYIDTGPGASPSFRTWLKERLVAGELTTFVTTRDNAAGIRRAKRTWGVLTGEHGPMFQFFEMQRRVDEHGFNGWGQATLNRYRKLHKLYGSASYRTLFEAWKREPVRRIPPRLVVIVLEHSYEFLSRNPSAVKAAAGAGDIPAEHA